MYIELWQGLRDLMHDNDTAAARADSKRFINWAIRDISNEYDWEFLRGTKEFTTSASAGVVDLNPITQLTASANTIWGIGSATADDGNVITIYGKTITGDSALTYNDTTVSVSAGVTGSASTSFAHITAFEKAITTGSVIMTNGSGNIIATLGASDTYVSNDIRKINALVDVSNDRNVYFFDYNEELKGSPDLSYSGVYAGYDIDYRSQIRMFNASTSTTYKAVYQRLPKYLIRDTDRTEFPEDLYQDIIGYAYLKYGLRYQDESDAWNGIQSAPQLLEMMINKWVGAKDDPGKSVLPTWYRRRL